MNNIKSFNEFVNETYLDKPVDVEVLDYDEKKMKKNGYIEVEIIEPVDGVEKGDKVFVSSTEFGQLEDDSMITCYKGKEEIIIPKRNIKIEM